MRAGRIFADLLAEWGLARPHLVGAAHLVQLDAPGPVLDLVRGS